MSSFGVFAVILGMIIGGFLLAYMISCLQSYLDKRPQQPAQPKPIDPKPPEDKSGPDERDLEAGPNTIISEKPAPIQQDKRPSLAALRRPGILRWSKISVERPKPDHQDFKDTISRPTRLLPSDSTYVVVRSPFQLPPLATNRSSRARSLESHRLTLNLSGRRETDLSSGKTAAEPSSQTIVGVNDSPSPKGPPKRTIAWFDQLSSPLNSRSSRSNSLPSSWDEILHSPASAHEEEPRLRLGSVSELWLDFQSQLAVG